MSQGQISHSFDGQFSSIQNILVPISIKTTNMKKHQFSGPFIEANLQMSGWKTEKALPCRCLKGICAQVRAHPSPWPS